MTGPSGGWGVVDFVAELVMIALGVVAIVLAGFAFRRAHRDSLALLALIEAQTRTTRHAVKNLALALNLQHIVKDLDGDGVAVEPDDDLAAR